MSAAVSDAVEKCELCAAALPSKRLSSALAPTTASRPMQAVGLDLFHAGGRDYLVMVDWYSKYPFVQCLASTTAAAVTRALAGWWELFGSPVVRVDGGPQFCCQEFLAFCGERDIELETSSPYNPRSNRLAEAAFKNCKKLLLKCIFGGKATPTPCLSFATALGRTGFCRRRSCSAGACNRPSRQRRKRSGRFPWRWRRRQGRKHMKQLWRELEPAVWKNTMWASVEIDFQEGVPELQMWESGAQRAKR